MNSSLPPTRRQALAGGSATLLTLGACDLGANADPLAQGRFYGRAAREAALERDVISAGFEYGARLHIMAFKESKEMELWLQGDYGNYGLYKTLPICVYSGDLGPKLAEGDGQTPEGYYRIRRPDLHPDSGEHLALELNFPNAYDRQFGRTGSWIRIHGGCTSIGCYAMTDPGIETIYLLAEAALRRGVREVTVASYPFRPTQERLTQEQDSPWFDFWTNLAGSHEFFMNYQRPPVMRAVQKWYYFTLV